MPNIKDQPSKLIATASSPVKIKGDKAEAAAFSVRNILMVIALIQKIIAFIEGPIGQGILNYIRQSKDSGFRTKVKMLGQKLMHAADGPPNSALNENHSPIEPPYNRPGHE